MRTLALLLCLALPVAAQPADAPIINTDGPLAVGPPPVVPVERGLLLPPDVAIAQAKRITACEVERDNLKVQVGNSTPNWVIITVVGVLALSAGIGAGYGISKLTQPKP